MYETISSSCLCICGVSTLLIVEFCMTIAIARRLRCRLHVIHSCFLRVNHVRRSADGTSIVQLFDMTAMTAHGWRRQNRIRHLRNIRIFSFSPVFPFVMITFHLVSHLFPSFKTRINHDNSAVIVPSIKLYIVQTLRQHDNTTTDNCPATCHYASASQIHVAFLSFGPLHFRDYRRYNFRRYSLEALI